MANLEDSIRSAVLGGNIGKPLMIAFIALLASGALFRGSSTDATAECRAATKVRRRVRWSPRGIGRIATETTEGRFR